MSHAGAAGPGAEAAAVGGSASQRIQENSPPWGGGCSKGPGFPVLKSQPRPKLLFLWRSGHVIDGGAGNRNPAPPPRPRSGAAGEGASPPGSWNGPETDSWERQATRPSSAHLSPSPVPSSAGEDRPGHWDDVWPPGSQALPRPTRRAWTLKVR